MDIVYLLSGKALLLCLRLERGSNIVSLSRFPSLQAPWSVAVRQRYTQRRSRDRCRREDWQRVTLPRQQVKSSEWDKLWEVHLWAFRQRYRRSPEEPIRVSSAVQPADDGGDRSADPHYIAMLEMCKIQSLFSLLSEFFTSRELAMTKKTQKKEKTATTMLNR